MTLFSVLWNYYAYLLSMQQMNKGNPRISKKSPANDNGEDGEAGEASLEEHEEFTGNSEDNDTDEDEAEVACSDEISE